MSKLAKFQMVGPTYWMGTTKENHLGSIFQLKPQKASELMVQLLAWNRGKTLDTFLSQFPIKEFETDDEFTWDVIGSSRRNIPLKEARTLDNTPVADSDPNVGVATTPFYLVFPEAWFADGEYIVGNLNEVYQFRILGDPRYEGTDAVYKVELAGGNTDGVPASRLQPGEKFSIDAAFVEHSFSRRVGDIRFASPVAMRNEWSTVRIQHKVGGSMLNKKVAFGIPMVKKDVSGKMVKSTDPMWMHYVDWELECQFNEYKNNALAYGRSNRNSNGEYMNFGKSGEAIRTGAGLFEQMEVANTRYYNSTQGVMKLILDALYELSASKLEFGDRSFVIKTGERGALIFNREAKAVTSGWTPIWTSSDRNPAAVEKTTAAFAPGNAARVIDYQVTEWVAPMGVKVKLDVDPFYDDTVRNKIMHPEGGVAYSYRYDIFYIGTPDQPNIQKCQIKGQPEYRGYEWGFRNPFTGQMGNPYMSHDEDSATFHRMATLGIVVLDPTRTMSIIPAILQG